MLAMLLRKLAMLLRKLAMLSRVSKVIQKDNRRSEILKGLIKEIRINLIGLINILRKKF